MDGLLQTKVTVLLPRHTVVDLKGIAKGKSLWRAELQAENLVIHFVWRMKEGQHISRLMENGLAGGQRLGRSVAERLG